MELLLLDGDIEIFANMHLSLSQEVYKTQGSAYIKFIITTSYKRKQYMKDREIQIPSISWR